MPVTEETSAPGAIQSERDAWVQAIDKLCSGWKKKYKDEHVFKKTKIQRNLSIAEETENNDTFLESNGGFSGGNMTVIYPPAHYANTDPTSGGEDRLSAGDTSRSHPSADYTKPVPKPRKSAGATGPDVLPPIPPPASPGVVASSSSTNPPPSPNRTAPTVPEPVSNESGSSAVTGPSPPSAPPPPPLLFKPRTNSSKPCTKAFHWDVVSSEKVTLLLNLHQKTLNFHIVTVKSKANSFLMKVCELKAVFYYFDKHRKLSFILFSTHCSLYCIIVICFLCHLLLPQCCCCAISTLISS